MNSQIILLARVFLSILFIVAGVGKLAGAEGFAESLAGRGFPAPLVMAYLVGAFELLGGAAIIAGFQTRIAAVLLALFCIATGLIAHLGETTDLMKNIAIAGGFLVLAASGPGSIAVDRRAASPEQSRSAAA